MTDCVEMRYAREANMVRLKSERPAVIERADKDFGATLKRYREARRVSQSKLAERSGHDHSYVSRIEGGTRSPSREAIHLLAGALELDQGDRDVLLAAGGFLPDDVASLLASEPEVADVLDLLRSDRLGGPYREAMRHTLRSLVAQARIVAAIDGRAA